MKKRLRLSLTGIGEVLTAAAEKKLEKEESYQVPTCDNGLTESQYEDLGIPMPQNLLDKLKKQDNGVELEDEDFEVVTSEIVVYADQIKLILSDDEFTTIFLEGGITVTCLETADEIDSYISYLERNWFERLKDEVSFFFRRLKTNKKK